MDIKKNKPSVPHLYEDLKSNYGINGNEWHLTIKETIAKNKEIIEKNREMVDSKPYKISNSAIKRYPQVTEQNLNKLEDGMSYEQVSSILGGKGLLTHEIVSTKIYRWYGDKRDGILVFKKIGDGLSLDRASLDLPIAEPASTEGISYY